MKKSNKNEDEKEFWIIVSKAIASGIVFALLIFGTAFIINWVTTK